MKSVEANAKKPTIAVLMSTYNGEKYIREQLDSLFAQSGVSIKLYIRDDGSTDDTLAIVGEYAKDHPVEIYDDGKNVGPGESFMRLIGQAVSEGAEDYFSFADQDDIWLEDKLISAVEKIRESGSDGPALYCSNQYLYIGGESKGPRYAEKQAMTLIPNMTRNMVPGCTFVFNRALAELAAEAGLPDKRITKYQLHDTWMILIAILSGSAVYDETPHMLYRIHDANVVGIKKKSILKRMGKLQRYFVERDDANLRSLTAKQLLESFGGIIETEDRRILELYANYQRSWKDKKALAFNSMIRENCRERPWVFTLKVLANLV